MKFKSKTLIPFSTGFEKEGLMPRHIRYRAKWKTKRQPIEKKKLLPPWRNFLCCLIEAETKKPASYADRSNYC